MGKKDLVDQLGVVMTIFEDAHPGCILIFMFKNSQNHHARPPNGLSVDHLNQSDGGKNTKPMRETLSQGQPQSMKGVDGMQKGIRTILQERGEWVQGMLLECHLCKANTTTTS